MSLATDTIYRNKFKSKCYTLQRPRCSFSYKVVMYIQKLHHFFDRSSPDDDLLTRPKMPFKVMHRKEVTHSNGSYERKSRGRKLADEIGRGKKNPIILS